MIDIKCGNCIDLLDTIPDGSVDLILTDPPYNISIKNSYFFLTIKKND